MKIKITYVLMMLLSAMIWGFAIVAQIYGADLVGPFTMTGVRFAIGCLALIPVIVIFERRKLVPIVSDRTLRKKGILSGIVAGVALFCATSIQQFGINTTGSAGITGLITGLYTVLVPLACFLLFRTKIKANVWVGAVAALLGTVMLCYRPGEGISLGLGELLLFVGTLCWTIHFIVLDKLSNNLPPLSLSFVQFSVCAVLGIACMFIFEEPTLADILAAKIPILYCGILSVGVAYTLQVVAQSKVPAALAAIVLSTESVFSAIGGVIFGTDEITIAGYVGCAVFFCGIVYSQTDIGLFKKKDRLE